MYFSSFLLSFHYPCRKKQATDALVGGAKFYPFHQDLGAIPDELQQSLEDPNVWASLCVDISRYRDRSNGKDCLWILLLIAGAIPLGVVASKLLCRYFTFGVDSNRSVYAVFLALVVLLVFLDCLLVAKRNPTEKGLQKICEHHREAFATQGWGLSVHTEVARSYQGDCEVGYTYYYVYVILFLPLKRAVMKVPLPTNKLGYTPPSASVAGVEL